MEIVYLGHRSTPLPKKSSPETKIFKKKNVERETAKFDTITHLTLSNM